MSQTDSGLLLAWPLPYTFLFFVISQSFMAFDQVMTFEYPWINTLFSGYFFVEAL